MLQRWDYLNQCRVVYDQALQRRLEARNFEFSCWELMVAHIPVEEHFRFKPFELKTLTRIDNEGYNLL